MQKVIIALLVVAGFSIQSLGQETVIKIDSHELKLGMSQADVVKRLMTDYVLLGPPVQPGRRVTYFILKLTPTARTGEGERTELGQVTFYNELLVSASKMWYHEMFLKDQQPKQTAYDIARAINQALESIMQAGTKLDRVQASVSIAENVGTLFIFGRKLLEIRSRIDGDTKIVDVEETIGN